MISENSYLNVIIWLLYVIAVILGTEVFAYLWHHYGAHDNYIPGIQSTHDIHHMMNLTHEADEDFVWILLLLIVFELSLGIAVMLGIIPGILAIVTVIVASCVFWWNWWIHRSYHQPNHWLNNYSWFQLEKNRHFIHHYNQQSNYGIASHFMDKIFNTWIDIEPS